MSAKDEKEIWDNYAKRSANVLRKLLKDYPLPNTPEGRAARANAEAALREHDAINAAEEGS